MSFLNRLTSEGSERLTEDLRALRFPNVFPVSDPGPALNTLLLSGGLSDTLDDIVSGLDRLYAQVQGQLLSSPDAPSPSVRYALSSQGICEALFFAWEVLSVAASAACLLALPICAALLAAVALMWAVLCITPCGCPT